MGEILPFERPETRPCPACGRPMDVDAVRCRTCGAPIKFGDPRRRGMPWWMLLGVILALAVLLGWLFDR